MLRSTEYSSKSKRKRFLGLTTPLGWLSLLPLLAGAALFGPTDVHAQGYLNNGGDPSFGAPEPIELGFTDQANGQLHLEIPLGSFPQRGGKKPLAVRIVYNSTIWSVSSSSSGSSWVAATTPNSLLSGWRLVPAFGYGLDGDVAVDSGCQAHGVWTDEAGTQRFFSLTTVPSCASSSTAYASDSSGYKMYYDSTTTITNPIVYGPDGSIVYQPQSSLSAFTTDNNGNYLKHSSSTGDKDTLGRGLPMSELANGGSLTIPVNIPNSSGQNSTYTVTGVNIPVKTNFGQPGVSGEFTGTIAVVQSITLPDSTSYTFKYDCDSSTGNAACGSPAGQSGYYGLPVSVTLPTGGQITYGWIPFSDSYSNKIRWLNTKTSQGGTWTYTPQVVSSCSSTQVGCQQKVTVSKPSGASTVYLFTLNNGAWPVQVQYNQGGTALSTVNNTYDFSQACTFFQCHGAMYIRLTASTTTVPVPGGQSITKQTKYSYDTPQTGNVTTLQEWGYYPGTSPTFPSIADRTTYTAYLTIGINNINRPTSVTVCNNSGSDSACSGGGSRVSQTLYTYDGYSSCSSGLASVTGVSNHDDQNFGASYTTRGNPTLMQRWVSGSTYLNTQMCYDTTGQITQVTDPKGNATVYGYTDNFFNETGTSSMSAYTPSSPTNAYPKTITEGGLTTTFGYYYGSGNTAFSADPNNATTSRYYSDPFDRSTLTTLPSGWEQTNYTSATQADSYASVADTSPSSACTSCRHNQINLDTWGRKANEKLVNAPGGAVNVDTTYDTTGRVSSVSHPYVNPSDPTHVFETFSYDGLDRKTSDTHPDNQSLQSAYGKNVSTVGGLGSQQGAASTYGYGYPVLSIDETGKKKQEWIDGFGRTIEVDEITTSGAQSHATLRICCTASLTDQGTISITVGSFTTQVSYNPSSTANQIASALGSGLNGSGIVTTSVSGSTITMTSVASGASANYSFSSQSVSHDGLNPPKMTASPNSGTMSGGADGNANATFYTYDGENRLTGVSQGVQTRTFAYDGVGRLTTRTTPEAGTENLYYTMADNATLCAGAEGALCRKTDARGVLTTYAYDSLSRIVGKNYTIPQGSSVAPMPSVCVPAGASLPPQNVCYNYDQGGASAHALGRLTQLQYTINSQSAGSEAYSYDTAGRITQVQSQFGGMNWTIGYGYNVGGQLTSITYPSGRVVTENLDVIGRSAGITDGTTNYVSNLSYNADQQMTGFNYSNGIVASFGYDPNRSQMNCLDYSTTNRSGNCAHDTTTKFGLNYSYAQSAGNNGQIAGITDNTPDSGSDVGHAGRSVNYTYDVFGRLSTALTTGSTQYPQWGLSYSYDQYGNRLSQTVTAGSGPSNSLSFATTTNGGAYTNRPDGYSFDASGNMLSDGSNTFTYDGENRIITSTNSANGTSTYYYDAVGHRIANTLQNGTIPFYIFSGEEQIAEYGYENAISAPTHEYVYSDGELVATLTGSTVNYHHQDQLSVRVTTDANGNKVGEQGHYPFGESWYAANTTSKFIFTSYERDADSGNDYAMARFYISRFGRFCTADPLQGSPEDPQSWNRYAYVRNDPTNMVDPSGQSWFSWLIRAIIGIFFHLPLPFDPTQTGTLGTPPFMDNGPLSDTSATLNSIYHPVDPSKFGISNFQLSGPPNFSELKWEDCSKQVFGGTKGSIPGDRSRTIPSYEAVHDIAEATFGIQADPSVTAATMAYESNFNLHPRTNHDQDVGPMQVNLYWAENGSPKKIYADTFGTGVMENDVFNGDVVSNIRTGAEKLQELGRHPENYAPRTRRAGRRRGLSRLVPLFNNLFDCLYR